MHARVLSGSFDQIRLSRKRKM